MIWYRAIEQSVHNNNAYPKFETLALPQNPKNHNNHVEYFDLKSLCERYMFVAQNKYANEIHSPCFVVNTNEKMCLQNNIPSGGWWMVDGGWAK